MKGWGIPRGECMWQVYIWFRGGDLKTFWDIRLLSNEVGGAYPQETYGLCHWMHLLIRNKNIYGLVVGIWMVSEILRLLWSEGVGVTPGTQRLCHWMPLIIRNKNMYGLWDIRPSMKRRGGGGHAPGTQGPCHWMCLIIKNINKYGLEGGNLNGL